MFQVAKMDELSTKLVQKDRDYKEQKALTGELQKQLGEKDSKLKKSQKLVENGEDERKELVCFRKPEL